MRWCAMSTDLTPEVDPQAERLHQMASSIEALNARIARLAIGLGVSLNDDEAVLRVLSRPRASGLAHERRAIPDFGEESRIGKDPAHRIAHKWDELQGLLVLRYGVETRYVEEVGVVATHQILVEAEEHLIRRGFNAGDDGINLDHLANGS